MTETQVSRHPTYLIKATSLELKPFCLSLRISGAAES